MSKKIRLPNGRYIKVKTDDLQLAKQKATEYYKSGGEGFVDIKTEKLAEQYNTKFDYETGVNAPWLRAKIGAQETLLGKENVVKEAVGTNGYTIDSKGSLALTPLGLERLGITPTSGKNVVIDESNFSFNDFADFSGVVGPIIGSIAGSILTRGKIKPKVPGLKTKTLMDLGKISVGTGSGAVVGKSGEEALEFVSGLQDNTPGELAELAAQEFALGAGGEFVFGVGGKLLKATFGQNALAVQGSEIGADKLKRAAAFTRGLVDTETGKTYKGAVALAALDSPLSGRLQPILETIGGSKFRVKNLDDMLIVDLKNTYRATNDLTEKFNMSINDIKTTGFADAGVSVTAGRAVREALKNQHDAATKSLEVAESKIKESTDKILQNIDAFGEPASSEAGFAIREFAEQSYRGWKQASDDLYNDLNKFFETKVDAPNIESGLEGDYKKLLPGGTGQVVDQLKWIDSRAIRSYAKQVEDNAIGRGIDAEAPLLKDLEYLTKLGGDESLISLRDLLNVRSDLASKVRVNSSKFADLSDLERTQFLTVINNMIKRLSNGDDYAVTRLAELKNVKPDSGFTNEVKSVMQSFDIANRFFSRGLQAFDDVTFKGMLNDAASGGWDTDKILTKVLVKNNGEKLKKFLDTLNVETAGLKKQYDKSGRLIRSRKPTRTTFLDEGDLKTLKDANIELTQPVFNNTADVQNMLQREFIRDLVKKQNQLKGPMNYTKLANSIDSYGTTADILFGGQTAKKEFIKTLKETDQLLDVGTRKELDDLITKTSSAKDLQDALKSKITRQTEIGEIEKLEVFKRIQRETVDPEEIVTKVFKSANAEDIAKVKELLGPESVEFKQFQEASMRKILEDVVNPGEDVIEKLINDGALVKALDNYGSEVLKETFGEQQAANLLRAKDNLKFAMGGERAAGGGGLFTQGFLFRYIFEPIQATRVFTPIKIIANLLGRPSVVKWLAGETTNKEFAKQVPSLLDSYGVALPAAKVAASQLTIREAVEDAEEGQRYFETKGVDPRAPLTGGTNILSQPPQASLDLPEIENLEAPRQTPISRSLLGGSPANEDIARSLDRLA